MDIRPILSTLLRHKTAAALIVLEIALSCAIVCNALFLIGNRLERMQRPTGLAESEIVRIRVNGIARNEDAAAVTKADLAALRGIPGVKSASATLQVPFGGSSWNSSARLEKDQKISNLSLATYMGGPDLFDTLGLKLIAGRQLQQNELIEWKTL